MSSLYFSKVREHNIISDGHVAAESNIENTVDASHMVSMADTDGGANHRADADNGLLLLETATDVDGRGRGRSGSSSSGGGGGRRKGSQRRNGSAAASDRRRSRQPDGSAS